MRYSPHVGRWGQRLKINWPHRLITLLFTSPNFFARGSKINLHVGEMLTGGVFTLYNDLMWPTCFRGYLEMRSIIYWTGVVLVPADSPWAESF